MSNTVSFHDPSAPDGDLLVMSNGGTDVFISVLALSGAAFARTDSEKRLMVYLSERAQAAGRGCAGFTITGMPWDRKTFEPDKRFMIKVIHGARNHIGWEKLDYSPSAEIVSDYLARFECLINKMTAGSVRTDALAQWLAESEADDPIFRGFPRCGKHGTFLTCFGCQICGS